MDADPTSENCATRLRFEGRPIARRSPGACALMVVWIRRLVVSGNGILLQLRQHYGNGFLELRIAPFAQRLGIELDLHVRRHATDHKQMAHGEFAHRLAEDVIQVGA